MNIALCVMHLRPNADPLADFEVHDNGAGQRIAHWDEAKLGSRPTDEELQAAWMPALKTQKSEEVRRLAIEETQAVMPIEEQVYSLLVNDHSDPRLDEIKAVGKRRKDCLKDIEKADSPEAIEAAMRNSGW